MFSISIRTRAIAASTASRCGLQSSEYRPVRSLSGEINGKLTGGRKKKFIFAVPTERQKWPAAPAESCQLVVLRSLGGRSGSLLVGCKRRRRVRGGFHRWIHISTGPQQCADIYHDPPKISIQSSLESIKLSRMRRRRLSDPRPIPEGVQEPICPRKKCAIWTRWRPVPVKNANYPRAPSSRRSGLVGPHTTPAIVNYKYMTSTL